MTGRELIVYILKNNLEDEHVFKGGTFVGYLTVRQAAILMNVGVATVYALIGQNKLDYVVVGAKYFVSAESVSILKCND